MYFAKWESIENMKKNIPLIAVNGKNKIKASGLPIMYDEENLYIDNKFVHSLIIGSTGSGKTQTITLPMLELSNLSDESVVVHDTKNELYEKTNQMFRNSGYNVIRLNFDDSIDSNNWNPFELPLKLYKSGNKDKAQDLVEELGFYLLKDLSDENSDPFWINSVINYFTGITLYAYENYDVVNLDVIQDIDFKIRNSVDDFLKNIEKRSNIYVNLNGILNAPMETKGSILSVFDQKIKKYISKENLKKTMERTDFDITKVGSEKTIIYVVSGNSNNSEYLLPLLISQIYYAKDEYSKNSGRISVIIDDFFSLHKIKDFSKILNYSRSVGLMFTIMVRGFNDLNNIYGKEESEIIKLCFGNTVYLLSQDIKTLEEFSDLCGKTSVDDKVIPLISVEELKTLKVFQAIILKPRIMPIKTKLLPHYLIEKII